LIVIAGLRLKPGFKAVFVLASQVKYDHWEVSV